MITISRLSGKCLCSALDTSMLSQTFATFMHSHLPRHANVLATATGAHAYRLEATATSSGRRVL